MKKVELSQLTLQENQDEKNIFKHIAYNAYKRYCTYFNRM